MRTSKLVGVKATPTVNATPVTDRYAVEEPQNQLNVHISWVLKKVHLTNVHDPTNCKIAKRFENRSVMIDLTIILVETVSFHLSKCTIIMCRVDVRRSFGKNPSKCVST